MTLHASGMNLRPASLSTSSAVMISPYMSAGM